MTMMISATNTITQNLFNGVMIKPIKSPVRASGGPTCCQRIFIQKTQETIDE